MKILWAPLALGQLQEIVDYIARDKPGAAARWADRMFDLAETLTAAPHRGRVVPEIGRKEVRELLDGNYRMIYRIDQKSISILTVRHSYRVLDPRDVGVEDP